MAAAGDLPETQLIGLLDLHVDKRTKQHIEMLRCLGLVESVVTPEGNGERPIPLAPTVASRSHSAPHWSLFKFIIKTLGAVRFAVSADCHHYHRLCHQSRLHSLRSSCTVDILLLWSNMLF